MTEKNIQEIWKVVDKLNKLIKKEKYPLWATERVIGEIVNQNTDDLYQMLGILEEAMLSLRQAFYEAMQEENNQTHVEESDEEESEHTQESYETTAGKRLDYIG